MSRLLVREPDRLTRPCCVCASGARLSIQASSGHMSAPEWYWGSHGAVEVMIMGGFVAGADLLYPFDFSGYRDAAGPFSRVPSAVVADLLALNGGIVSGECPGLVWRDDERRYPVPIWPSKPRPWASLT